MAIDAQTSFPAVIMAGTTQRITLSSASYPASSWTGYLGIVGEGTDRRATWSASGDDHAFVFSKGDTSSWPPGEYRWHFIAEEQSSNERIKVSGGSFYVTQDILAAEQYQSHNEKVLAALKNYQLNRLDQDAAESFTIDGQSFTHTSADDINRLISRYEVKVKIERDREDRRANGTRKRYVRTIFV